MMKSALFIATCFFAVILLPFIPYRTVEEDGILIHSEGMLPSLFNFSILCSVTLLAAVAFTQFKFKKHLNGNLILKRKDLNLDQQLAVVAFWIAFILVSQLLSNNYLYLFSGLTAYFIIILGTFSAYILFKKWFIKKLNPDFLSIDGETIYLRSFFGKGKREIKNLKVVSYDPKSNALLLQFHEGLENIKLHLTDYKLNELKNLIEFFKNAQNETIQFDENLSIFFGQGK